LKAKIVMIKNVKIILPSNAELLKSRDLDEAPIQPLKRGEKRRRSDIALAIKCGKYVINIVIENTGTPEPKDVQRLEESYSELVEEGFFQSTKAIKMLLLHHRGKVHGLLVSQALSYKVELLRCNEDVDLNALLTRRGFECQ